MNVVLLEPEIPQNTGNIARICAASKCKLHMIRPFGFSLEDRYLKRAGLDYWKLLDISYYDNFKDFLNKNPSGQFFMATTKAKQTYADVNYDRNSYIVFGKESAGIPEEILLDYKNTAIRIPMAEQARSLNLANSVAIILYEALRQQNFGELLKQGQLHKYNW